MRKRAFLAAQMRSMPGQPTVTVAHAAATEEDGAKRSVNALPLLSIGHVEGPLERRRLLCDARGMALKWIALPLPPCPRRSPAPQFQKKNQAIFTQDPSHDDRAGAAFQKRCASPAQPGPRRAARPWLRLPMVAAECG